MEQSLNLISACLCSLPGAIFIVNLNPVHLFCDTVVPGSYSHLKHDKHSHTFSRWFTCVREYGIILPHLAGGKRLQMPLWMITAILKGFWQVSTDERF